MSQVRVKLFMSIMLLSACCALAGADDDEGIGAPPPPKATCDFAKGYPKAGSKQGEILVVIEWANCTGVDNVVGGLSKTVNGQPFLIGKGFSVQGTQQNPLNATGSYSWNYATGEQTGTVITSGTADAFKGNQRLATNGGVA